MNKTECYRIKKKILQVDPTRYWGDDFDVRYYLISKLKTLKNKSILDVGGGIGIVSSELDKSNFRVNLDLSFQDLKICMTKLDASIQNVCSSMTNIPFPNKYFNCIICSHLVAEAKQYDLKNNLVEIKNNERTYPTVDKCIKEIHRVLKIGGILYLTTPNNAYYESTKLNLNELDNVISSYFPEAEILFYNTLPRLNKKYRKLNLANIIPKLKSKIINADNVINSLINTQSKNNYSVSFFVKAERLE